MGTDVRLLDSEVTLSTADSLGDNRRIRVYNNSGGEVMITRANSAQTVIGTCTMANNEVIYFVKDPTDTLEANGSVLAVAVAFGA